MEMSVRALLVSGCVCRYVLMDSDTELWVVAMPLALHSSGAAFALGITIAADAMPPSRPPARTPYRPRRAVIVVFFEFIECLPLICDGFIAAQGLAVRSRAKTLAPRRKASIRRHRRRTRRTNRRSKNSCLAQLSAVPMWRLWLR